MVLFNKHGHEGARKHLSIVSHAIRESSFRVGHSKIVGSACLSCWMKGAEHLMRPSRGKGSLFPLNICLCFLVPQITFKLVPSLLIPKI